jgi:hypothetical protein
MSSIDEEWCQFISKNHSTIGPSITIHPYSTTESFENMPKTQIKTISQRQALPITQSKIPEMIEFNDSDTDKEDTETQGSSSEEIDEETKDFSNVPKCDELYISTKTKVVFLNQEIDIHSVFWKIPIIEYWKPMSGIIKKQIKIVSKTPEEYTEYRKKLEGITHYTEHIIKQIDNPTARRMKFKDERKLTVGVSKKDIMNCRGKVKNAFYNCFAMILRFMFEGSYREIHVKIFNTGKIEIPGILNTRLLDRVKEMVLEVIQPFVDKSLTFIDNNMDDNVLINSNFNCGFYINREKFHSILNKKYGIETSYDPCSYPGVKCKFYFNNDLEYDKTIQLGKISSEDSSMKMSELKENKKYTEVTFVIFRTGSCLIVGNCSEKILVFIFEFIKKILIDEYANISIQNDGNIVKTKKTKLRKRSIKISSQYHQTIMA